SVILPQPDDVLEAGDEMLFVAGSAAENQVRALIVQGAPARAARRREIPAGPVRNLPA
ncbi:TrkA family potassium uptake protein, partial [Mycobacterium intracellulare]|nr:TrkA family potassium uptake protein [Mycobacterium intracellulare]